MLHVTILGAGTAIPAPRHSPAGVLVRVAGERVLLDAGPGTLQRLRTIGVSPVQVDRVFLTHYHVDHCLELVTLLFALRIPEPARTTPLSIYGPRGLRTLVRRLDTAFHGWLSPRSYRLTLQELDATTLRLPGYTVRTAPMRHTAPALGYRLEIAAPTPSGARRPAGQPPANWRGLRGQPVTAPVNLAYSGDTDVCPEVVELGRAADLLILECSMPDERKVAGHLTPSECGRIAREAGCRHLVLTHFYPVFERDDIRRRVRRAFRGRLTLARDLHDVVVSARPSGR
jgi:ribonuclease BN (tRNA processing enzyme)